MIQVLDLISRNIWLWFPHKNCHMIPGVLFSEHKDMAGEALVHSLGMVLEHRHVLFCYSGNIPVRDHDRPVPGHQDPVALFKGIMVQVLHGIGLFYADRLAVGKIGHDCPDAAILYREPGGVGKEEVAFFTFSLLPRIIDGSKSLPTAWSPSIFASIRNPPGPAERVEHCRPGLCTREIDERSCHPWHHDPGMKELAFARVALVVCPAIDPVQDSAEITLVL